MDRLVCIEDYEREALRKLLPSVRDFYQGGAGEEYTLKLNADSFRRYRILPRVLRDVSKRDISTTVLNERVSMPLGLAPSAMQRMAHPDGECASAKAAQDAGTVFILSTLSTISIEDVARAAPSAIKWFQLYVFNNREVSLSLVRRAENAGFKALVLTIDAPVTGDRRMERRHRFSVPDHLSFGNFDGSSAICNEDNGKGEAKSESNFHQYIKNSFDDSLSWKDVDWLKSKTHLPIILKGILTVEDALLGVKHGASAIYVSNHGGRQLDCCPATIEVLPKIVDAVGSRVEVYMDGGVRQGTDVFKALALGARMVFLGRPLLWSLACGGEKGTKAILDLMKSEIDRVFALSGTEFQYFVSGVQISI